MDESGYHYDADALRALDDPRSTVFLTGKAGAGKSTLIRHWRSLHPNRNILTLAPTGIAALNVQGVTQNARRMWETPATYGYLRPKDRDYITGNTNSQETRMQCIIQPNGGNYLVWFDGTKCHNLTHPDQVTALQMVAKQTLGHELPCFKLGSKTAPWYTRLLQAVGQA